MLLFVAIVVTMMMMNMMMMELMEMNTDAEKDGDVVIKANDSIN